MKLASLKGSRDGRVAVASQDLNQAAAIESASTMQQVLDDWPLHAPALQDLYATLNAGTASGRLILPAGAAHARNHRAG